MSPYSDFLFVLDSVTVFVELPFRARFINEIKQAENSIIENMTLRYRLAFVLFSRNGRVDKM